MNDNNWGYHLRIYMEDFLDSCGSVLRARLILVRVLMITIICPIGMAAFGFHAAAEEGGGVAYVLMPIVFGLMGIPAGMFYFIVLILPSVQLYFWLTRHCPFRWHWIAIAVGFYGLAWVVGT